METLFNFDHSSLTLAIESSRHQCETLVRSLKATLAISHTATLGEKQQHDCLYELLNRGAFEVLRLVLMLGSKLGLV